MASDLRQLQQSRDVAFIPRNSFLPGLQYGWTNINLTPFYFPGQWFAISGSFTDDAIRGDAPGVGCPDYNRRSDGVVCEVSAQYALGGPTTTGEYPNRPQKVSPFAGWAHASKVLMGTSVLIGNSAGNAPVLYNPPPGDGDPLLGAVVDFVIQNP